jgi:predicted GNAT family N-acyltransferase
LNIEEVMNKAQYEAALLVRKEVFIEEQGVPFELEVDEFEDSAIHFVAYDHNIPVGAGRLRQLENKIGKVERVCVIKSDRGKGIGKLLMDKIASVAKNKGVETLKLNSQTHAENFYQNLGYETYSDVFMDAGIPHVAMKKQL